MTSLISPNQKIALQAVMDDIHDTFKRSLKAYKEEKKVILSSNPNYSHIYKKPIDNIQKTKVERTIEARVFYFARKQEKASLRPAAESDLTFDQANSEVRLKVHKDDFDFLNAAERIVLDDHVFLISSTEIPHGLFGEGFYSIYLRRAT